MTYLQENPRVMRWFVWSGPALIGCWLAALLLVGRFIPPKSPSVSAHTIAVFYQHHATALRIDTIILMLTGALFGVWGCAIASFVKRMDRGWIFTFGVLVLLGGGWLVFDMIPIFWGMAAFRPGEVAPQITQMLNDLGWFAFLFDVPPFMLLNLVLASAILRDKNDVRVLPRWVAYLSLWEACLFSPAMLMIFTKHGPIAYNGLIALYIPLAAYFTWMAGVTFAMLQAIKRDQRHQQQQPEEAASGIARGATIPARAIA